MEWQDIWDKGDSIKDSEICSGLFWRSLPLPRLERRPPPYCLSAHGVRVCVCVCSVVCGELYSQQLAQYLNPVETRWMFITRHWMFREWSRHERLQAHVPWKENTMEFMDWSSTIICSSRGPPVLGRLKKLKAAFPDSCAASVLHMN
jgi:hypothetical protein